MALKPVDNFPGQIAPADAEYPYGKARDVAAPGDNLGTPYNALKINDDFGFHQALLDAAGITPSGVPDKVGASQYLDAINALIANAVGALQEAAYPVGSIYVNATVATNPATLLGFGTWVSVGAGRVLVGLDAGDPDFNTAGQVGGSKTHALTSAQLPNHNHQWNVDSVGGATTRLDLTGGNDGSFDGAGAQQPFTADPMEGDWYTGGVRGIAGVVEAHNNVQPYLVVYMWRRTA